MLFRWLSPLAHVTGIIGCVAGTLMCSAVHVVAFSHGLFSFDWRTISALQAAWLAVSRVALSGSGVPQNEDATGIVVVVAI